MPRSTEPTLYGVMHTGGREEGLLDKVEYGCVVSAKFLKPGKTSSKTQDLGKKVSKT